MIHVKPSAAIGLLAFAEIPGGRYVFPVAVARPDAARLWLPYYELPAANEGEAA